LDLGEISRGAVLKRAVPALAVIVAAVVAVVIRRGGFKRLRWPAR
jgi:hypothetical protein